MRLADAQDRVVVTKDDDFVRSFLIARRPTRLLLVATGNIDNTKLIALLRDNLTTLVQAYEQHRFVELARYALVIHE